MRQPNSCAFNKGKKVWVAGFLEKKHRSIIRGPNWFERVWERPLHWVTAVADFLDTFENWMPLLYFDNAEWIRRQWTEMLLKKCASEIREARNNAREGNKEPGTDLGERAGKKA
jgi:hypothetical protein